MKLQENSPTRINNLLLLSSSYSLFSLNKMDWEYEVDRRRENKRKETKIERTKREKRLGEGSKNVREMEEQKIRAFLSSILEPLLQAFEGLQNECRV